MHIQPSDQEETLLRKILNQPIFIQITESEKSLIWQYRYWIKQHAGHGLPFVLLSTQWQITHMSEEMMQLLNKWGDYAATEQLAIPLLGEHFSANDMYVNRIGSEHQKYCKKIRAKACDWLRQRTTAQIELIFLQLVQAFRYEDFDADGPGTIKHLLKEKFDHTGSLSQKVYWAVNLEIKNPVHIFMSKEYEKLFKYLFSGKEFKEQQVVLERQTQFVNVLKTLQMDAKSHDADSKVQTNYVQLNIASRLETLHIN